MNALLAVFRTELYRIFLLRPAFSVLIIAAGIYAVFYPQPYLNEALRKVPIALVDQDNTVSSRELARRVVATPDVAIVVVLPDLPSAEREVFGRDIYGIVLIPKDFERDLLHGRSSPIALYADAGYFLLYQRIGGAVSMVAKTFGAEIETARLVGVGIDPRIAAAAADPLPLTAEPLFNPQGGYATYILPAAFILILQQMLLIGVGLLGTSPSANPGLAASYAGPLATVLGKLLAYVTLEMLIVPLYLVVLPFLYGVPRLGTLPAILTLALPFVLSVSCLGLVIASIFRNPLVVQLALAAIGLPFFFLAGFAWPSEALPEFVRVASVLVPSTSAIDGLVRVAQLGAPLSDVRAQLFTLWVLTTLYGCLALLLEIRKKRVKGHGKLSEDGAENSQRLPVGALCDYLFL